MVRRLVGLVDWTDQSQASAEDIIGELEKLIPVDPPDFLRVEINEAVATAWVGIGNHFDRASKLAAATSAYRCAIEAYQAAGETAEARKVRLKLVSMIRRLAVDFDETITQIAGMLDEIEAEGPSLQRAQMRLELAETYVSIGDHEAARAQIQAAEQDSWGCGWPAPDLNNIGGSFVDWVAHAEATSQTSGEFAEALFTELTVEATALALRARVATEASEHEGLFLRCRAAR